MGQIVKHLHFVQKKIIFMSKLSRENDGIINLGSYYFYSYITIEVKWGMNLLILQSFSKGRCIVS